MLLVDFDGMIPTCVYISVIAILGGNHYSIYCYIIKFFISPYI